ncbi:MazG-like family protein [Candidatus Woesearchaeota archaeon]|nr:MazG-like family protein [Candidatus Woesearchaeota archaeon]
MNLDELQRKAIGLIEEFDKSRGIRHDPATTMIHLVEEFGEVARELYNEKSGRDKLDRKNLAGEIADIYLPCNKLAKSEAIRQAKLNDFKKLLQSL